MNGAPCTPDSLGVHPSPFLRDCLEVEPVRALHSERERSHVVWLKGGQDYRVITNWYREISVKTKANTHGNQGSPGSSFATLASP